MIKCNRSVNITHFTLHQTNLPEKDASAAIVKTRTVNQAFLFVSLKNLDPDAKTWPYVLEITIPESCRKCKYVLDVTFCLKYYDARKYVQRTIQESSSEDNMNKIAFMHFFLAVFVFSSMSITAGNGQSAFNDALSAFDKGNFSEASAIVEEQLQTGIADLQLKANFLFLHGRIQSKNTALYQEALDSYLQALQLYTEINDTNGLYNTHLKMAQVYLADDRPGEAESALETGLALVAEHHFSPFHLYLTFARLAFQRGHYEEAMTYGFWAYQTRTPGDTDEEADALIALGFYQMLNGYMENGRQLVQRGQIVNVISGNQTKHLYTLVNLALYDRCQGKGPNLLWLIRDRALAANDAGLIALIDYVDSFDCSATQLRPGEPPPPEPAPYPEPTPVPNPNPP